MLPNDLPSDRIIDGAASVDEIDAHIAALTTWRDCLITWRADLDRQLRAIRLPIRDDVTRRHAMALGLSIERIDRGLGLSGERFPGGLPLDDLMRESGHVVWLGTLSETEQTLRELTQRSVEASLDLPPNDAQVHAPEETK
jgi:hypothetical protein